MMLPSKDNKEKENDANWAIQYLQNLTQKAEDDQFGGKVLIPSSIVKDIIGILEDMRNRSSIT